MEVEDLGQHISRRFNEDLESVRSDVLKMRYTTLDTIEAEFNGGEIPREQNS